MRINNVPATYNGLAAVLKRSTVPGYWNVWAGDPSKGPTVRVGPAGIPAPQPLTLRLSACEAAPYANNDSDRAAILGARDSSD